MIRFVLGIIVIGITFYIALIYASTAIGLLGFAEAVLLVLAFFYLCIQNRKIKADIDIPIAIADEQNDVKIHMHVENRSRIPCFQIRYLICNGDTLSGKMRSRWEMGEPVTRGKHLFVNTKHLQGAGNYRFELKKIRIYDMTGLFYWNRTVHQTAYVQVLPKLTAVNIRISEQIRNFYGEAAVYDEQRAGEDNSQIFDVREFVPGDRIQKIHWKLSAKSDTLLVREDSQPLACAVVLLLNPFSIRRMGKKKASECYLSVAADLAFSFLEAACPIYAAWYSSEQKDVVRMRIDEEESYYVFLSSFMKECIEEAPFSISQMYQEKYRYDHPVYQIEFSGNLMLTQNGEAVATFTEKDWKKQIEQLELVL